MDLCRRLEAIEEIRALKARYFRLVDAKDWDNLEAVFAADATFDRTEGNRVRDPFSGLWEPPLPEGRLIVSGRPAVMRMIRNAVEKIHSVHQGHMPEIEILDEVRAHGIWAMTDELLDPDGRLILRGSGHYHETYTRLDRGWVIQSAKLTRIRLAYGDGRRP